ncbi:TPA: hypothetical protein N0F65_003361 [Lagenidium giganteum]|uniref:Fatty acid hydroxylase domain-containing protein n=1 Tax=Lagenidium giganteum TaxID=4803 RepID=A0AAV2ZAP9_9STRA|nr:TPA: hypothetical protein N0F65_003361 [Lagenidium giganteum]
MDFVLEVADEYGLDLVYPSSWPRDSMARQVVSVAAISIVFGYVLYFTGAIISFYALYDKKLLKHPKFGKNQIREEIMFSVQSIPIMALMSVPCFMLEVRGYTKLYKNVDDYGVPFMIFSVFWFLFVVDFLVYCAHNWLHWRSVYAWLHKSHHRFIVPTPFASHAFHPLDGFVQGVGYHIYVMFFPIHRVLFLTLFVLINYWTISIHDSFDLTNNGWINGSAHHAVHHKDFVYNYGQYFTLWDRVAGTYQSPRAEPEAEKEQ